MNKNILKNGFSFSNQTLKNWKFVKSQLHKTRNFQEKNKDDLRYI
jgi:hypothetical protein